MIFKSIGALCAVGLGLMVIAADTKASGEKPICTSVQECDEIIARKQREIDEARREKAKLAPETVSKLGPIVKIANLQSRAICHESQNKISSDACLMKQNDAFDYCNNFNKDFNTQVQVANALGYKWKKTANGTGKSKYTGEVRGLIPAGAHYLPTLEVLISEYEKGALGEFWFWTATVYPSNSDSAYKFSGSGSGSISTVRYFSDAVRCVER